MLAISSRSCGRSYPEDKKRPAVLRSWHGAPRTEEMVSVEHAQKGVALVHVSPLHSDEHLRRVNSERTLCPGCKLGRGTARLWRSSPPEATVRLFSPNVLIPRTRCRLPPHNHEITCLSLQLSRFPSPLQVYSDSREISEFDASEMEARLREARAQASEERSECAGRNL
eukprot:4874546-Pleurochrysis_carterae.AAC.3